MSEQRAAAWLGFHSRLPGNRLLVCQSQADESRHRSERPAYGFPAEHAEDHFALSSRRDERAKPKPGARQPPERDVTAAIREAKVKNLAVARSGLQQVLPNRLAGRWLDLHAPGTWSNQALEQLERQVHEWIVTPVDTEGYAKAEVTAGGVDTDELSAKTMESRKVPGLFFIGEVVDVTGHLGGFNFQWAWASGAAAGRAV